MRLRREFSKLGACGAEKRVCRVIRKGLAPRELEQQAASLLDIKKVLADFKVRHR
jgi:hypothetical protein